MNPKIWFTALRQNLSDRSLMPSRRVLPFAAAAVVVLSVGLGYGMLRSGGILHIDESKLDVIVHYEHADNSLVYDRNGKQIGEFFSDYHVYYPFEKIPQPMINALLSIEDRNFFEHNGVDLRAILRASLAFFQSGSFSQGASTITQQVVRNFLLTPERKFSRKIKEALYAVALERRLTKDRILEVYLNALFLGQGSYGVGAAAQRHFGKPLEALNIGEMALIAGLFQSPTRFNPHKFPKAAKRRQLMVLKAMKANGFLSGAELLRWRDQPLVYHAPASMNQIIAPYFLDAVQEQTNRILAGKFKGKGLRITTTLDLALHQELNVLLQNSTDTYSLAARNLINVKKPKQTMIEAASLVLNHRNGQILAMIGGRNFQRSQFNRTLKAKRSPGSCFKPVVYAQALMGGTNWSDITYITPVVIQNYRPQNYSYEYMSESTYYHSFYRSINTPVVELGSQLGIKKIVEMAYKMGVKTELKSQAGTLLGGSDMTMLDLAHIYGTIGNDGVKPEPYMIEKIVTRDGEVLYSHQPEPTVRIYPPAVAYMVTHAMQAVFRYGTASRYPEFARFAAGKTGTTNEAKDNWFCGITRDITSIVWVGTDENHAFSDSIAANTIALPIWAKMMTRINDHYPQQPFTVPEGVEKKLVHPLFGYEDPNGIEMPHLIGRGPHKKESTLSIVRDTGSFRDALDW